MNGWKLTSDMVMWGENYRYGIVSLSYALKNDRYGVASLLYIRMKMIATASYRCRIHMKIIRYDIVSLSYTHENYTIRQRIVVVYTWKLYATASYRYRIHMQIMATAYYRCRIYNHVKIFVLTQNDEKKFVSVVISFCLHFIHGKKM